MSSHRQNGPDLFATPDLFGNLPSSSSSALASPPRRRPDEIDTAAELLALRSGRPKSQERAELARTIAEDGSAWRKRMGHACPSCHAAPDFRCRKTCALRRADPAVAAALGIEYGSTTILSTTILDAQPQAQADEYETSATSEDDFENEDGPDFVDEGADVDAAWDADALAAEAAGDPNAAPESAPFCDECKIGATIHEWASPRGRQGFPCPPGSFERDRAAYEASVHVGERTERGAETWEVTQHAYTRKTEDRPAWFTGEISRADLARYRSANCYGAHWVERRVVRADLFSLR